MVIISLNKWFGFRLFLGSSLALEFIQNRALKLFDGSGYSWWRNWSKTLGHESKLVMTQHYIVSLIEGILSTRCSCSLKLFCQVHLIQNNCNCPAPLPNVMSDGRICWGNVCPISVNLSNVESAWSKFISSTFNRDYTQGKSKKYKNNIIEQLGILNRKIKVSSRCRYRVSDLVPIRNKLTVEQAVEAVIKNVEYKQ